MLLYTLISISLQLLVPVLANPNNQMSWPAVVSKDLMRHVGSFKGEVFLFSGQVKGKTLLPLPPQADLMVRAVESEER